MSPVTLNPGSWRPAGFQAPVLTTGIRTLPAQPRCFRMIPANVLRVALSGPGPQSADRIQL